MAIYNITSLQSATTITEIFTFANDVTDQLWFGFLIVTIFFVLLIALKRYPFENAMLSSAFATFLLSSILTYAGYLNFLFPLFFLIVMALTGFYMYMTSRD